MIRIGTRGSALALWQAEHVAGRIRALGREVEIIVIKTTGDLDQKTDFGSLGAKGVFVKEIEAELIAERIDLAVHSLKDLPTELPEGLVLAAALEREDPRDVLVSREGKPLAELPGGARVASGSMRRIAQILALRPDLVTVPLRGNVGTRIGKIRAGEAEATLLAAAGLRRLGMEAEGNQTFDPEEVTPSMGQGALGLETRTGELEEVTAALQDDATRVGIDAERVFISRVGGGCKTPAGVYARAEGGEWLITGMLASPDGKSLLRETRRSGSAGGLNEVAKALAADMVARADDAIRAALSSS